MNSERWIQIKGVFAAVVDMPPGGRESALAQLCGGDLELKSEVERLLLQHEEMGGFLEGSSSAERTDSTQHMFSAGDIVAGRYRILEFMGSGGMGEVYAAEDKDLSEQIAIKMIREEAPFGANIFERLRREVQLARRVTHPNVCRVFDLGRHQQHGQDVIFLTMELIRGETLSERLKREGKIHPRQALLIATQLCDALDAAHQVGVLHRDFKTSNVMVSGAGEQVRAVVTDFGIARLMNRSTDSPAAAVTSRGMVIGTPAYMSPEQLLGEELSVASDIYSLGLVLYEMVTAHRPFAGASSWTETLKRLSDAPKPPMQIAREVGARWNSAILRCLDRDPAKRFSSARTVARFLSGQRSTTAVLRSRRFQMVAGCLILTIAATAFALRNRIWPPSLPAQKHVAILPFSFQGTNQADQARAYELAESLTVNLSHMEASDGSLWVVPWDQVKNQKPEDAAREASFLGVNLLVTGELQRANGALRLILQLNDAKSLRPLRSKTAEIQENQVTTLEDRLFEQASSMLQLRVPQDAIRHLPVDATTEPGAYEFYEQGRGYLLRFSQATPEELDRAIALLQRAIEKDPGFALAYANLAYAYATKYQSTRDTQWIDKAKPLCQRALALNDKLAPSHLALGLIDGAAGDPDGAIREFEKALQLDPTDDAIIKRLSMAYDRAGRLLQAEALLKDALKRRPGSWNNYNDLGFFYFRHADYMQAEPLFRTATQLAPDNPMAFFNLGGAYLAEGKYQEAESVLAKGIAIRATAPAYSNLALAYQYQGHYDEAASMLRKAAELDSGDHRYWGNLGTVYELAGNQSKAVEAFQMALQLVQKGFILGSKDAQTLGWLALYHAELGQRAKAQEALAQAPRSAVGDPEFLFHSTLVYELIGERDRALAALRATLQAGFSLSEIQNAPELAKLRQDKRYDGIIRNSAS